MHFPSAFHLFMVLPLPLFPFSLFFLSQLVCYKRELSCISYVIVILVIGQPNEPCIPNNYE